MASDLEARLDRLEDWEAIRELAVHYCYTVDRAQAQVRAELFAEDNVVDSDGSVCSA